MIWANFGPKYETDLSSNVSLISPFFFPPFTSLLTFCFEDKCTDPVLKHQCHSFQADILMCIISEAVFCQKKLLVPQTLAKHESQLSKTTIPGKKSQNVFLGIGFICYLKAWGNHVVFGQDILEFETSCSQFQISGFDFRSS